MEKSEKVEELDRTFDLLLVLLGIITAALFQFQCTRLPLEVAALNPNLNQLDIFTEMNRQITTWLRVFFIPLILLIGVWFFNRIGLRTRTRARKIVSEFCYIMSFTILGHDVVYFIGAVALQPLQSITSILVGGGGGVIGFVIVIFILLISLGLVYSYETPAMYEKTRKEAKRIWKRVLVRTFILWFLTMAITNWIEMLSVYGFI